jgi:hypothetical protein
LMRSSGIPAFNKCSFSFSKVVLSSPVRGCA